MGAKNLLVLSLIVLILPMDIRAQKDTVKMVNFEFQPEQLTIEAGDTVIWVNATSTTHTTTSGTDCTADGTWNSGNMDAQGDIFSHVFDSAGDFPYYCIPHCGIGMTGKIVVQQSTGIARKSVGGGPEVVSMIVNPYQDQLLVEYKLNKPSAVTINLYNMLGERVRTFSFKGDASGNYQKILNLHELNEGVYLSSLMVNGKRIATQMISKM